MDFILGPLTTQLDVKLLLEDNFRQFNSLSSSGAQLQSLLDVAHTAHLAHNLAGWMLQEYSDDGFRKL